MKEPGWIFQGMALVSDGCKEGPQPATWLGAAGRVPIGTPSAGLSLGRVASPQSPPPFHPARRAYPETIPLGKPDRRPDREK
jgi:hypothetical protein